MFYVKLGEHQENTTEITPNKPPLQGPHEPVYKCKRTWLGALSGVCDNHSQAIVAGGVLPKTEHEQLVRNKRRLQKSLLNETTTTEQGDDIPPKTKKVAKHQKDCRKTP
jgi:hypothetical protein